MRGKFGGSKYFDVTLAALALSAISENKQQTPRRFFTKVLSEMVGIAGKDKPNAQQISLCKTTRYRMTRIATGTARSY